MIFDIKRFAVHDGPGIRTTVFFKGCSLNCWWCHNPESRSSEQEMIDKVFIVEDSTHHQVKQIGKMMDSDSLMAEITKDKIFYEESGGGVTFSGGEPLDQPLFLKEILLKCRKENIHTCLDTSGYATSEIFSLLLDLPDLFLYDLKLLNNRKHKKYTGVSNRLILNNLERLAQAGKKIVIRYPVITGINDQLETIKAVSEYLTNLNSIKEINLLPFHQIARDKYTRFKQEYKFAEVREPSPRLISKIKKIFTDFGFTVKIGG